MRCAPRGRAAWNAAIIPARTLAARLQPRQIRAISWGSGSLRLAAQDVALSRRKQGFESPRERQHFQKCSTKSVALPRPSDVLARLIWTLAFLVRAIQPG